MPDALSTTPSFDHGQRLSSDGGGPAALAREPGGTANVRVPWTPVAAAPPICAVSGRGFASSTGILLHLASVGFVAVATIGVFFGIGFSLLRQPVRAHALETPARIEHGSAIGALLPHGSSSGDPTRPPAPELAPEPAGKAQPTPTAAASATLHSQRAVAGPPKPAPRAPIGPDAKTRAAALVPAGQIAELVARGDVYLRAGDIASARLFYERAADAGDGQAALRLGVTFDPAVLSSLGLRGMAGDVPKANFWYRRARALGESEAEQHLNSLKSK